MALKKKLFLLDGFALIYRAYFAFIKTPRINSQGLNTSAPFGFTNTLYDVLKKEKPDNIVLVLDPPGGSFRNELYPPYKANRQETPEDLRASIPWVIKIAEAFNIPVITITNYEADDVIGTLAKQAALQDYDVYMMTMDKDYCQLVEENIRLYRPKSFGVGIDILGIDEVKEKFGVETPQQVIDILGLWGDSSDNVPGAPGIGEKRAQELIANYGSIEGVYDHIDELKGKQKENLLAFKEQILLSKDLVTIRTDVPVEFDPESTQYTQPDAELLTQVFTQLEFGTMINRILQRPMPSQNAFGQMSMFNEEPAEQTPIPAFAPIKKLSSMADTPHQYHLVDNAGARAELIAKLDAANEFCFDTETTSIEAVKADIVGLSFAIKAGEAYYLPFGDDYLANKSILHEFASLFAGNKLKIGQNLKYDILVLMRYGIVVKGPMFDTMVAHYLIQPEMKHGLDFLAEQYLSYRTQSIDELIGKKGKDQLNFRSVPVELAKEYSGEDADITLQLKYLLEKELAEKGASELFWQIEAPLVPVLAQIEWNGVSIDTASLADFSVQFNGEILRIEADIYAHAGHQFNIASPKQLGEVLYDELKLAEKIKLTKTNQYSTSEETLLSLKGEHPIVRSILDYRGLKKLTSTYIDALPKLINPATGRIHTSYNQTVVATGRLSSTNPNLQNIPIRTEQGKEVRRAFIPQHSGSVFISADYSQIELRLIAHFSGDDHFIQAFLEGEDIHAATAAKIFHLPIAEVTSEQRSQAKGANFGIVYGISVFGLSQNLGISRADAKALIDGYFAIYPGVKRFMDECIARGREKGYVETLFGRRRYLPDINSRNATVRGWAERNAINAPIQGTGADIIKKAMIAIQQEIDAQGLGAKLIMQVHDELNFEVPVHEAELMSKLIKEKMESAVQLSVPLTAQVGKGSNWLEAH